MKTITIYGLHLGTGGTEKCISMLANSIRSEFNVRIVSTYKLTDKPFFNIDDKVEIKYLLKKLRPNREQWKESLKKRKPLLFIKESVKALLTLVIGHLKLWLCMLNDKSDIVISTRTNFNTYVGLLVSKKAKKIAWEHNHHNNDKKKYNKCIKSVKKMNYYVLNSKDLYNFYKDKCKCACVNIPNSIDDYPKEKSKLNKKNFVSVGRLSHEKGFTDLIDLFYSISKDEKDWHLSIVGDGVEREVIEKKIKEYGLQEKVIMHGYLSKDKINEIFSNSSLYLMTSLTESFGIVLVEAMSYGLPCIAYDSAEGAKELIKDGYNGYLVENRNIEDATKKIISLINNSSKMKELSNNARNVALDYTIDKIKEKWMDILR